MFVLRGHRAIAGQYAAERQRLWDESKAVDGLTDSICPVIERLGRWAFAGLFVVGGILHFVMPKPYILIVPPMLPRPDLLVMISGGAEIVGGIGLLLPRFRRPAGYGLALLLLAVFPANIYMAVAHVPSSGLLGNRWLQWLRLPIQFPLIWLALHYAKPFVTGAISPSEPPEAT